ncbi:4-hydroxyphenylacetate 3-hydroxylase family protein [Microbacterium sp.]|uniref:4-hydroxyphenylacetate 3-hydroxylase family protein n=1 Tax=Microbacterium sp. TaxID=51671 RepID=UPI003A8A57F9
MSGPGPTAAFTGAAYLDSIRDDREIWFHGERVRDAGAHPAFAQSLRTIAGLYDGLHDGSVPLSSTDTDSGGSTHPFFVTPRTGADLRAARDAIAAWARQTFGWMGRTPDYKAALVGTFGVPREVFGPFQDNATRLYRQTQERVLFWNHAIVDPPVDRDRPPDEVGDIAVRVVAEDDHGITVSGAKVVATGAVGAHLTLLAPTGARLTDESFAVVAALPMDTPGLRLLARPSYEYAAQRAGSPFDYPLSSRFDENDVILVLDRAVIAWENVLVHRDIPRASAFIGVGGFPDRLAMHGATRLAVKLDFLSGLLHKAVRLTGASEFRGVQARLGEVLAWRSTMWALSDAMVYDPVAREDGTVGPQPDAVNAYRLMSQIAYPRVREIALQDLGSALIYQPSHAADFEVPELRDPLHRYLRGSDGTSAPRRVQTMKMLWDAVGSEFAGRSDLYERSFQGSHEGVRLLIHGDHERRGETARLITFAEQAMTDYDRHGWRPGSGRATP